ncbi:MAG TPA: NACHT domain-containing protein, partial [Anaerolineae bacterium]|nr:NACHT domain-containing protein [Anaerolineae bacterium]HQH40036.1 NACHT domain-containing protein [Anaerolineae bacterium]
MEKPQTFSEWIAYYLDLLTGQGRTQAKIAQQMRVHPSLLTKWKAGDYGDKPTFDNVTAFADVARLTPQQRVDLLRAAGYDVPVSTVLDAPEYIAARERYLAVLRERYGIVETHAFTALSQDEGVGNPRRLPLLGPDGVYVPLCFDAPAVRQAGRQREFPKQSGVSTEAFWESTPETLPEILKLLPGHLAIIGDAGSGKTTALHVIVSALASANPETAFGARFSVLDNARPLPIFLPLRLFEQACNLADNASHNGNTYTHCPDDLLRFVDDWFAQWETGVELPEGFLASHIRGGRAWFLLDALDEVANTAHRVTVRNVIQNLAGQLNGTRLIVTARVAAYRDIRLDERFTVVTVRDLDDTQRGDMVRAIYRGLALPDHARRADDLVERFAGSKELQALGRTPVMVWTAAVIHALRGELPDSRAALYDAYVDILLKQSFKRTRYDVTTVDILAEGQGWPLADRLHYLTYAAFQVHTMLAGHPERHDEQRVVIGEDELADDVLAPYFHANLGYTRREARDRAREFITLMVERSGLLYETDQGYTFGDHLTMQEFLAAYYLAENYALEDPAGYAAFFQKQARHIWWREVVLLAAGYLGQKAGFQGSKFLTQLAKEDDPVSALTSLALAGRGLLQLRAGRKRPRWYATLAQDFANRLYRLVYAESVNAPVTARQEAGLVLGLLYGMPGEESSLQDPRFTAPLGLPDFIEIPAGTFWMGGDKRTDKDECPRHQVTLDAYAMAKYPTTNAMYARFIADEGYT